MLIAILAAVMCLTTISTVGRTAAAEAQVVSRLDAAGSRQLVVTDAQGKGFLTGPIIDQVARFSTVDRAVGLGAAVDVTTTAVGSGGTRVPMWRIVGDVEDAVKLVSGRAPQAGEAIASASALRALGLSSAAGSVSAADGASYPVVGQFEARSPFGNINDGVVLSSPDGTAITLAVIVKSVRSADSTERAVIALLDRTESSDLAIDSPTALADVQSVITGDLSTYSRSLVLLVLGSGGFLVAAIVFTDTLIRRRDLGRRRALGATRWFIVALVVSRTFIAAVVGTVVGVAASIMVAERSNVDLETSFSVGTAVLAVLTAACAAIPPGVAASLQDPVKVLRKP